MFDFGSGASDAFDLSDVTDLADVAGLGDIIDGIDFLPLDGFDVAAVVDFDPSDLAYFDLDSDMVDHASSAFDVDPIGFETVTLDSLPPEMTGTDVDIAFLEALQHPDSVGAFSDYVSSTLDTYPQHLLAGLDYVEVSPDPVDGYLGMWTPQEDGSIAINLWNHVEQLPSTTHHELAHHVFSNHPEAEGYLAPFMQTSPIMQDQGLEAFLEGYPSEDRPGEFAAQIFSYYKTNPRLLQALDPQLFATLDHIWTSLASGAA